MPGHIGIKDAALAAGLGGGKLKLYPDTRAEFRFTIGTHSENTKGQEFTFIVEFSGYTVEGGPVINIEKI